MPLKSDITLDYTKFALSSVSKATSDYNDNLIDIMAKGPKWYEVGAEKYRQMRWNGETPLPAPTVLEGPKTSSIPSRDKGRNIPTRVFEPEGGSPRGVFMHIHGGGWVLQSEAFQDPLLQFISDCAQIKVVSVGYRLAPENPYPAGPNDCFDAAEWLVDNCKQEFGLDLLFIGGESAGAHLSALTCFHLIHSRPQFEFRGVLLFCGAFDLAGMLPQVHHYPRTLIIDQDIMEKYLEAFLPNTTMKQRMDPEISPLFANLPELAKLTPSKKLPAALLTCGTEDPLLDDTVVLSMKWMMSGSPAVVKIYPGAPHAFQLFPTGLDASGEGRGHIKEFLSERLG